MPFIIPANSASASGGFDAANSCRFNAGSSDYLSRTFGSGNRKTWTWSAWIKLANINSSSEVIFGRLTANNDSSWFSVDIRGNDKITIGIYNTNYLITNRLFRDTSAWYHIVVAFDTTQGTANNRVRLYINGVEETSFATRNNPSQNFDAPLNANVQHLLGKSYSSYYEGYMSEVTFIDGQQLAPTDFGEFDEDSGVWKPIKVSGLTFGNNGFYLDFEDSSALGNDAAGSNNFTANNLTAIDQSTDTCTNNFATINPLIVMNTDTVYSEGNLVMTPGGNTGNWQIGFSSIAVSAGKWYVETKMIGGNYVNGISETTSNQLSASGPEHFIGGFTKEIGYYSQSGNKFVENSQTSYGASYTNGDIIGMALDLDSGTRTITFFKNGASQGAITLPSSMETMTFGMSVNQGSSSAQFNFGSPPYAISSGNADGNGYGNFEYAVPSGYFSLNTKNLAEYG